jgi:hypothetical protein
MYTPLTVFFVLSVRGIYINCTNTIRNYICTTPMLLENENKHKGNEIKGPQPPSKNI